MDDATGWDPPGDGILTIADHRLRGQVGGVTTPARRLLAIVGDDRLRSLETLVARIPTAVRARIRVVAGDLRRADARLIRRWCPKGSSPSRRLPSHQDAHRRLQEIRRLEPAASRRPIPPWPRVTGREQVTAQQPAPSATLVARWPALGQGCPRKEDLPALLTAQTPEDARRRIRLNPAVGMMGIKPRRVPGQRVLHPLGMAWVGLKELGDGARAPAHRHGMACGLLCLAEMRGPAAAAFHRVGITIRRRFGGLKELIGQMR